MKKYVAGKDAGADAPDSREWVFGLLGKPRYRQRMQPAQGARPAPPRAQLRSRASGRWSWGDRTPDTLYHVGWCDSCRSAAIALGLEAPAAGSSWLRRRGWRWRRSP